MIDETMATTEEGTTDAMTAFLNKIHETRTDGMREESSSTKRIRRILESMD